MLSFEAQKSGFLMAEAGSLGVKSPFEGSALLHAL